MQLTMLGTGGYHPNDVRHTACFLLPELGIVFDAGTGMYRLPAATARKDLHLFISHPHWDHTIGLTYLLVPMMLGQIERVDVYANRRTLAAIQTHLFAESTFAHMPPFEFHVLEDSPEGFDLAEGCHVDWFPLPSHPGGSNGFVLRQGQLSVAYVTDTWIDRSYDERIRDVSLLIHECYFNDDLQDWAEKTGHSFLSQVVELAQTTNPGQLLLTHPDPRIAQEIPFPLESARALFPKIDFASDLRTIIIGAME